MKRKCYYCGESLNNSQYFCNKECENNYRNENQELYVKYIESESSRYGWFCPECTAYNETDADEVEYYAQICDKCGKEFDIETDDLFVVATKIVPVED